MSSLAGADLYPSYGNRSHKYTTLLSSMSCCSDLSRLREVMGALNMWQGGHKLGHSVRTPELAAGI